jgi:hypothetical protein
MDEFLAQLIQHKDQFDDNEEDLERVITNQKFIDN